jgi:hypothetical protein
MAIPMTTAEQIYERVKILPERTAREVLDFVDFLAQKEQGQDAETRSERFGRLDRLRSARGIWTNREDVPDIRQLRSEWDRSTGRITS